MSSSDANTLILIGVVIMYFVFSIGDSKSSEDENDIKHNGCVWAFFAFVALLIINLIRGVIGFINDINNN